MISGGSARRGLRTALALAVISPLAAHPYVASAQAAPPGAPPSPEAPAPPEAPALSEAPAAPASTPTPPDSRDADRDAAIFGTPPVPPSPPEDNPPEQKPDRGTAVFGPTPPADPARPAPDAEPPGSAATTRDDVILGAAEPATPFAQNVAPNDPLTIGGLFYLRAQSFALESQPLQEARLSVPTLAQVYFDVRPNERVRGYLQARLQYDPTLPANADAGLAVSGPLAPGASSNGAQSIASAFATRTREPRFVLDQLWVNFDIGYRAFVTVGKLHDRWGTARFWMPTDYLHLQNRNPIDVFDARAGTNMVKLHLPVEALAWNFYAYAILESPQSTTPNLDELAGALRAEFVLETLEIGLGIFGRRGEHARGAVDLSFGVWDLDLYGELALRDAGEVDRVRRDPAAPVPTPLDPPPWQRPSEVARARLSELVDAQFPVFRRDELGIQTVAGVTYSVTYDDDDVLTLGAEYFYNGLGYGTSDAYLGLLLPHTAPLSNPATFFYLGRHYLSVFMTMPAPFHLDLHTFTVSSLGNLSDGSYISRLDYSYTLLTHLRFEAFVAVHYGKRSGEFRFGINDVRIGDLPFSQPPSLFDLGLALRLEY